MKFGKNVLAGLTLALATAVHATPVGSIGFSGLGAATISPGNDITTASVYNISLMLNVSETGYFSSMPIAQAFGPLSLDINNPASFSLINPAFGSFSSSVIQLYSQDSDSIAYDVVGLYNSGSFDGSQIANEPASFLITFSQAGGPGNPIFDSASFSIPPVAPAPEPTTLAMAAVGGLMGLVAYRRRK